MRLLTENLFQQVLIEPAERFEADRMLAVSGYVTANMAYKHMEQLNSLELHPSIHVVAGMVPAQGMNRAHHEQFVSFSQRGIHGCPFSCKYTVSDNPVHSKVFIWMKDESPVAAFAGSANYTARGFGENQNEIMIHADPKAALKYYERTAGQAIYCFDENIENRISLKTQMKKEDYREDYVENKAESVKLPLVTRSGDTHSRAGLNWGQRSNRNPDQAYLPVPSKIAKRGFFPPRTHHFTVHTDDGHSFIFVVAQQGNKALHTPQDNSILGRYFRRRLKLESGQYVKREHLTRYGRTDVSFDKIDDDSYFMDFSTK